MKHENGEQLNLIYYVGEGQPTDNYVSNIPEITPDPQSNKFCNISSFTTSLYDTHTNIVGDVISNSTNTSISETQNIQISTWTISLPISTPNGIEYSTMTFGFNVVGDNNQSYFTGGQLINLNFLYGTGKYQNINVKLANILPVNDQNQTRFVTVKFEHKNEHHCDEY